jgi:hypothetical protein
VHHVAERERREYWNRDQREEAEVAAAGQSLMPRVAAAIGPG